MSIFSDAVHQTCGSSYCPSPINENVAKLTNITSLANNFEVASDISTTYQIASIYLGISLLSGVLMALFLDPPSKFEETKVEKNKSKQKISISSNFSSDDKLEANSYNTTLFLGWL